MGPAARGRSAPSRPSTARFAVPAARELEAGPALGVHPGWRKAFPSGRGLEPGALAVAPACLSLSIANVISHADFALALSVSCAVLPVRTCVPRHKVVFQSSTPQPPSLVSGFLSHCSPGALIFKETFQG
ncbi:hypothetical protein mRhiFer1_009832 [Rhinolophus ferrumequinum]|uniref:Uncharacterized protein n=1 Tax=Rhinolophus ferrumequinum TaxID=59479 RepID=A0A7J7YRQ2_RHIFE|nr:hypothetical protein mRhiFer1_009832 [Rhinolophus ferrumequinum]